MLFRVYIKKTVILIGSIFLILIIDPNLAAAQTGNNWMPQRNIPLYHPETEPPFLIADQNRTVHAFSSQWIGDDNQQKAIVYNQWNPDTGWTVPVDIILPPLKAQARLKGAYLDQADMVHLIFFSGDDTDANIYYSRAPLAHAGLATAWSKPQVIGVRARTPDQAAIVGDSNNKLFVLYSSNRGGTGLYFTYSTDAGTIWSKPSPMFLTYNEDLFPYDLTMYVDEQDNVHALWNVNNRSGQAEAMYYTKLEAGQIEWSEPVRFAPVSVINQPSIIAHEDELFLIYHTGDQSRHMRRSSDGGDTWTGAVKLFPHVGSNGAPSLVVDNNNVLYMFFGNRVGGVHGMWHSVWQGAYWSDPEALASGPVIKGEIGGEGFDPSHARAIVSQGNVILVTWDTDPQNGLNGVWYSYTTVDAPELPAVALRTPAPAPSPIPNATTTQFVPNSTVSTQAVFSDLNYNGPDNSSNDHPLLPVIIGTAPVVLALLAAVALILKFQQIRRL